MKNCSTKNFTNKIEKILDFNKKYKIQRNTCLHKRVILISFIERKRLLVSLLERYIY
jgi:hypothetical protein